MNCCAVLPDRPPWASFPFVCFEEQLLFRHVDAAALRQHAHDFLELFFVRRAEIDGHAEARHQG